MKGINLIILVLMISDAIIFTGFGLIEPVFAIFINQDIVGGSLLSAGFASTIFLATKSILQLPFSKYVDKNDHDAKNPHSHLSVKFLWIGVSLITVTPFLYFFCRTVNQIYLAQFVYGIGAALAFPTWLKLWETHIDKDKESFEWTLYSTLVSLTGAVAATVGAAFTQYLGFRITFLFVGVICFIGSVVLIFLQKDMVKAQFPIIKKG